MFLWLQFSFAHPYSSMSYDLILKYIIQPSESRISFVILFSNKRQIFCQLKCRRRPSPPRPRRCWPSAEVADQIQDRQARPLSVSPFNIFFIIAKQSIFIFSDSLLNYNSNGKLVSIHAISLEKEEEVTA